MMFRIIAMISDKFALPKPTKCVAILIALTFELPNDKYMMRNISKQSKTPSIILFYSMLFRK